MYNNINNTQVILQEPAPSSVSISEAITDEVLVSGALEMFRGTGVGRGGEGSKHEAQSRSSSSTSFSLRSSASAAVQSCVAGVVKNPSNHLVSAFKPASVGTEDVFIS